MQQSSGGYAECAASQGPAAQCPFNAAGVRGGPRLDSKRFRLGLVRPVGQQQCNEAGSLWALDFCAAFPSMRQARLHLALSRWRLPRGLTKVVLVLYMKNHVWTISGVALGRYESTSLKRSRGSCKDARSLGHCTSLRVRASPGILSSLSRRGTYAGSRAGSVFSSNLHAS